jgi:translation initiation factor IF-1
MVKADIALIQKPWVYKGQVRVLTNSGVTIYAVAPGKNSRSYIYIRNYNNVLPFLEFCSRDATTVRITYTYGRGNREKVVTSAYLPFDSDEPAPSKEMKGIIDYCYSRKK